MELSKNYVQTVRLNKNQCQHVDAGQCERCKNFRSPPAIKKHMQYRPFDILSLLLVKDGEIIWPKERIIIHGQH